MSARHGEDGESFTTSNFHPQMLPLLSPAGIMPQRQRCLEKLGQERGTDLGVENGEDGKERDTAGD